MYPFNYGGNHSNSTAYRVNYKLKFLKFHFRILQNIERGARCDANSPYWKRGVRLLHSDSSSGRARNTQRFLRSSTDCGGDALRSPPRSWPRYAAAADAFCGRLPPCPFSTAVSVTAVSVVLPQPQPNFHPVLLSRLMAANSAGIPIPTP